MPAVSRPLTCPSLSGACPGELLCPEVFQEEGLIMEWSLTGFASCCFAFEQMNVVKNWLDQRPGEYLPAR